ncbi:MAG: hypothetical protein WCO07_02090, partial [bacterium]
KYLLALFLLLFIIPTVAMASWWNPFSWFSKKPQNNNTQIVVPKEPIEQKQKVETPIIQDNKNSLLKQLDNKEYINEKYGFNLKYPKNWAITEKSFSDFFGSAIGRDFYKGLVVVMNNPDIPKTMYDCCYTKEEIEKNGIKPSLNLKIIESFLVQPKKFEYFGDKTKVIFNKLIAKGYPKDTLEKALSLIPSVGENVNSGSSKTENIKWKDSCNKVELLFINNNDVVKFSGCSEGVVQNTGAIFIKKDGLIIKFEDNASEYSNRGDFDKILESFKFTTPSATDCLPTTTSWIKVLSPNGGETYTAGQKVNIKWKSCNVPTNQELVVSLGYKNNNTAGDLVFSGTLNDGSEILTVPQNSVFTQKQYQLGKFYRAFIETPGIDAQTQLYVSDYSDNFFTIKQSSTKCPLISQPAPSFCPNGTIKTVEDSNKCIVSYICI